MNVKMQIQKFLAVSIVAGTLGLAQTASAGTRVGASVTVSGTRTTVAEPINTHVCTYEQRPVTRTFTDATGGRYEQRTFETVRVCTHAPVVTSTTVYKVVQPEPVKVRRRDVHTSYSIGLGYYGGSPSVYGGVGYHTSPYYGPVHHRPYRHYPRHRYGHHGNRHGHGHHGHH